MNTKLLAVRWLETSVFAQVQRIAPSNLIHTCLSDICTCNRILIEPLVYCCGTSATSIRLRNIHVVHSPRIARFVNYWWEFLSSQSMIHLSDALVGSTFSLEQEFSRSVWIKSRIRWYFIRRYFRSNMMNNYLKSQFTMNVWVKVLSNGWWQKSADLICAMEFSVTADREIGETHTSTIHCHRNFSFV